MEKVVVNPKFDESLFTKAQLPSSILGCPSIFACKKVWESTHPIQWKSYFQGLSVGKRPSDSVMFETKVLPVAKTTKGQVSV
jgi:hypothetical protein